MFHISTVARRVAFSLAVAVSVAALPMLSAGPASAANTACPTASSSTASSCTFTTTSESEFFVPAGVTSVTVHAVGAAATAEANGSSSPAAAGDGASVAGTFGLPAGATHLFVEVGTVGGGGSSDVGGAGGGESDVQTCSVLASSCTYTANPSTDPRLIVAGGGGGGGENDSSNDPTGGPGGSAGTSSTSSVSGAGGAGVDSGSAGAGGSAGLTSATGTSGAIGAGSPLCGSASDGQPGTPGHGGAEQRSSNESGAGGGGDGWVGGAAGGSGGSQGGTSCRYGSGGGGGGGAGLSYIQSAATGVSVSSTADIASVTISWKQPTTTTVACKPGSIGAGSSSTCTATVANSGATTGAGGASGSVRFSSSGHGKLTSESCTLTAGSTTSTCQVTFKGSTAGSTTIKATYVGDSTHQGSSGMAAVKVTAVKPKVTTRTASVTNTNSATLHGSVKPGGAKTTYYFEYGTTTKYGSKTKSRTLAAGISARSVSALVRGLKPGTKYHFRLVARNAAGKAHGRDLTFTTAASSSPVFTG